MQPDTTLAFTGERYVPEISGNIQIEHMHRYVYSLALAKGKRVLDIASGEGYGSALLASQAALVVGVDIAEDAVSHARKKYQLPNLEFRLGSCSKIPLADASVDLVVSFETIEHHDEHEQMLAEIKRVLKPAGLVIISSPDKAIYTDKPDYHNPFHVKELYRDEFESLFRAHFKNVIALGQKVMFGSGIIPSCEGAQSAFTSVDLSGTGCRPGLIESTYNLIIASDADLPDTAASFLDIGIDASETVQSWKATVAQRDGDIARLQAELAGLSTQLTGRDAQVAELSAQLAGRDAQIAELSAQLAEKDMRLAELSAQLTGRDVRLAELSTQLAEQRAQAAEYLYHLDRINAWGWFQLGLSLDKFIRAPFRLIEKQRLRSIDKQRRNAAVEDRPDAIASTRADASSATSDAAGLCLEHAFIQSEVAKLQSNSRSRASGAPNPTTRFDALSFPSSKWLLSGFEQTYARAVQRINIRITRHRNECRPAVLFASDYLPLYDQQSGGLRQKAIIEILRDLDFPVLFACSLAKQAMPGILRTDKGQRYYERALRKAGVVGFAYGLEEISACLEQKAPVIQRAIISFPHVAKDLLPLVRARAPHASIFYDMVDIHSLRLYREAELNQNQCKQDEARAMEATEFSLVRGADVVITVSDTERQLILEKVPEAVVEVIPNIFEPVETAPPGPRGRRDILFLGGFWHKPNGDGVTWFVKEIWPKIRSCGPEVQFIIAGSNPDADVKALEQHPGVKVIGYVADLKSLFDACRVFVAPLRYGAGMKGKVGQSLTFGLPLVSTSIGVEGIPLEPGRDFLLGNNPDDFAANTIRLLEDDELWTKLQQHGREVITLKFSPAAISNQIAELFDV